MIEMCEPTHSPKSTHVENKDIKSRSHSSNISAKKKIQSVGYLQTVINFFNYKKN